MIFLWIFGASLEDRLGHINFTLFYLMGGVVAGLVQVMAHSGGTIGASGSVFAVTGGFVVLSPSHPNQNTCPVLPDQGST